jgi:hypothetical protein
VVFQASVNGSVTFPATTLTVDNVTVGSISDIVDGMTIEVLDGSGNSRGLLRVAVGAGSGSVIQVNEFSAATVNAQDGDTVIIRDEFRIFDRLVSATSKLNKDSRTLYTDAGSNPPPVSNAGGLFAGFTDIGQVYATVTFDAVDSFTLDPDSGGTTSYVWDVDDGTITVGSTTTEAITVQFPVGFRHVKLTVTDSSNAKSTVRWVPVWVHSRVNSDGDYPKSVLLESRDYTTEGWTAQFQLPVGSEASIDNLPDGALVIVWEEQYYGGSLAQYGSNVSNRSHIKFVGFLDRDQITIDAEVDTVTFTAVSPLGILAQTPALPQLTVQASSPDKWHKIKTNSVHRTLWYLWYWHTTAFLYFDFKLPSSGDLTFNRLATTVTSNQLEQFRDIASSLGLVVTCDWLGRLLVDFDPQLLDTSARSGRTTAYNLTTADMVRIEWEREHRWQGKQVTGEGITDGTAASSNDPVFSRGPGNAPAPLGTGVESFDRQIVDNQADLNERTGLYFAKVNSLYNGRKVPRGLRLIMRPGYDVFDPALQEYVTLTLPASTNRRVVAFTSSTKWLVVGASVAYNEGEKEITYTLDHETFGPDGTTYTPPTSGENGLTDFTPPDLNFPDLELPALETGPILDSSPPNIAAFNIDGYYYLTGDYNTTEVNGGPTWTRALLSGLGVSGTVESFTVDAFSPLYLATGTTVNGWLVTTTGIYLIEDIFGAISATLQLTFASGTTNLRHRFIDSSFGFLDWIICISSYDDKVECAYTQDGGTNWTEVTVTAFGNNVSSPRAWPGLHISSKVAGLAYTIGFTATNVPRLYRSTNYGATWSSISPTIITAGTGSSAAGQATVHAPFHNNASDRDVFVSGYEQGTTALNRQKLFRAKVGVTNQIDITPTNPNVNLAEGPGIQQRSFAMLFSNRQRGAYLAHDGATSSVLYTTETGGESASDWIVGIQLTNYQSLALAGGQASKVMYLWGTGGAMGYSEDLGTTIDDRRGNIASMVSPIPGQFVNICGG